MYLLDRSTYRRIGRRTERSHVAVMVELHRFLKDIVFVNVGKTCGIVLMDAKHVPIRGKDHCEYLIFDIEYGLLARELWPGKEVASVYGKLLDQLQEEGLQIRAAVTDGLPGFRGVCKSREIIQQRCHVHLLRDLRTGLQLTTKHRRKRLTEGNRQKRIVYLYCKLYLQSNISTCDLREHHLRRVIALNLFCLNPIQFQALQRFWKASNSAFWHQWDDRIPTTTNQLEGYISMFNARLKTMRGCKKFEHADHILAALHMDFQWGP